MSCARRESNVTKNRLLADPGMVPGMRKRGITRHRGCVLTRGCHVVITIAGRAYRMRTTTPCAGKINRHDAAKDRARLLRRAKAKKRAPAPPTPPPVPAIADPISLMFVVAVLLYDNTLNFLRARAAAGASTCVLLVDRRLLRFSFRTALCALSILCTRATCTECACPGEPGNVPV